MDNLEKVMTVIASVMAVNGLIALLFGHLSSVEKLPKRKIVIIIGWVLFLGSTIMVAEKIFFK